MNNRKQQGRTRSRFTAKEILGYLAIVATIGAIIWMFVALFAPQGAGTYSYYRGPVLPVTGVSGCEDLNVERLVTLDFSVYETGRAREEGVLVTDSYTLTNSTTEDVTAELSFALEFVPWRQDIPAFAVDGVQNTARFLPQSVPDVSLFNAIDFEAYRDGFLEADLLNAALAPAPTWDVPVKVYHFYNIAYEGTEHSFPVLDIGYKLNETTDIWTMTYDSVGSDKEGRGHCNFDMGQEGWIYVIGNELEDMTVGGSVVRSMGLYEAEAIEGVTYELETYESTFMECLRQAAEAYRYTGDAGNLAEMVTPEMLVDYAIKQIIGSETRRKDSGQVMNGLFDDLLDRRSTTCWLVAVEIPAGSSVTVSASYWKEASFNTGDMRHGYDIATTLGSNLNFTGQRVRLVNTDPVTIARKGEAQNLGFDPDKGILEVTLDLTQERYYLDLLRKE